MFLCEFQFFYKYSLILWFYTSDFHLIKKDHLKNNVYYLMIELNWLTDTETMDFHPFLLWKSTTAANYCVACACLVLLLDMNLAPSA